MRRSIGFAAVWSLIAAIWYFVPMAGSMAAPCPGCSIAAVPEPTTLSLLATGAAATLYIFRRRK